MLRQAFSKWFSQKKTTTNNLQPSEQYNGQAQIYAIPTVSSNFESRKLSNSTTSCHNNNSYKQINSSNFSNNFSSSKNLDCYAKYDDNNTRQIYIAPHCIRYSNSTLDDTIYRIADESLNDIAAEILESENMPPKLQIVYYDSNYFAINNSHLQIYKQLQLSGLITHVQADLISVEAIPYPLREYLLQTPSRLNDEFTTDDQDYQEMNNCSSNCEVDNLSCSQQSNSNEVMHSEQSLHDTSDLGSPNVVYAENVYEDDDAGSNIYVDEVYEFGVCENCGDSGDELNVGGSNDLECRGVVNKYDGSTKLEVYLKDRRAVAVDVESDLNEVVRNVLRNEESEVCAQLACIRLDMEQKALNEDLFSNAENRQFGKQSTKYEKASMKNARAEELPESKNLLEEE